jgi:translation initiation factor IF-2
MKLPTDNKIVNKKKLVASSSNDINKTHTKKRKRRRINKGIDLDKINKKETIKPTNGSKFTKTKHNKRHIVYELSEEEIQKKIKETLVKLSTKTKSKSAKYRKHKRELVSQQKQEDIEKIEQEKKTIKVTEFVTVNELANMMDTPINEVIASCMDLGIFVSINQRINAETLTIIADEFGYNVEFVSVEVQEAIPEEIDNPKDLIERTPVITVMGHVDHGKTSLLDYIRKTNVIAGEAGGITQHIGAYEVTLKNDRKITFLDTPGHEAFTAMRSRGANITDAVIIVIAADEQTIMPQTIEAINHAKAAGVPIVFAINKIDKTNANTEKVKEGLSNMNILVEDWGGKYQSQEISAKKGTNIDLLLEKILLETDIMELKANPNRKAIGTVLESSLDKGRGYVVKLLVKNGTLKIGDIILAGCCHGKVKAMYNERNIFVKEAGPSIPVLLLGLNGAPQAGDTFNVMTDEQETRSIAYKRLQLQKEQHIRTQKHVTLDEIGRRIAIGNFKELNIIIKGDADGSIEALTDSALKLSNEEIQINIIHKAVGQITESDVLLASASDAIIIGFQVRPSIESRKLAKKEQIDIRLYSVIYTAIDELKSAMQGMLAPKITEKIVSNIEIKEVFKIGKVGTIAGCTVKDGKVNIDDKIHLIRNGIVIYTGKLDSLKRFKDDVKEVKLGLECGLNIKNFNDIKVGDIIEGYKETKVARKL